MKLLFCSDLHGDKAQYARLAEVARTARPDVLVLGGDMLPDDSALSPALMGQQQPRFVRESFRRTLNQLHRECGVGRVLFIFGNHDWSSSVPAMQELAAEGLVTLLDHRAATDVDGLDFVGYPCTPPTPWFVKDFERLDEPGDRPPLLGGGRWDARFSRVSTASASVLYQRTATMAEDLATLQPPARPWVFVAHAPPFGSALDRNLENAPFGSRAVRRVIETHRPILSLHGHVHESPRATGAFQERIGATVSVNVGQHGTKLDYATIDLDVAAGKVKRVERGQQA